MFTLPGVKRPIPCPRCHKQGCGGKCLVKGQEEFYCTTTYRQVSTDLLMAEAKRLGLPLRRAK